MTWLARLLLLFIHVIYGLKNLIFSFFPCRTPSPLLARRQKNPKHVALILVPDAENHDMRKEQIVLEECVERAINWCREVGIQRLSVYERDGVLAHKAKYASSTPSSNSSLSPNMCLLNRLTPPSSDTESSSKSAPQKLAEPGLIFSSHINTIELPSISSEDSQKVHRNKPLSQIFVSQPQQQDLTLHVLSQKSSKPSLAAVTRYLAKKYRESDEKFTLSVDELNTILEVQSGYPPPDLIIVYPLYPSTASLELHGFPPWHMRLSEIFYAPRRGGVLRHLLRWFSPSRRRLAATALPISEIDFRRALDEYSQANFKLGK